MNCVIVQIDKYSKLNYKEIDKQALSRVKLNISGWLPVNKQVYLSNFQ
jgi:hypothetical protein